MTVLDTIQNRNTLNIDTHERALIYAALLLRKANIASDNAVIDYKNAVRITTTESQSSTDGVITSNVVIEAKCPYDSQNALGSGGNFFENINPFSSYDPLPFQVQCEETTGSSGIGNDPSWVDNLEKYFVYNCYCYSLCLQDAGDTTILKKISFKILEEASPEPNLTINATIPYNYQYFLFTNNLFSSLEWCGQTIATLGIVPFNQMPLINRQEPYQYYSDVLVNTFTITNDSHGINYILNLTNDINLLLPDNTVITQDITFNIRFLTTSTGVVTFVPDGISVLDSSLNKAANYIVNLSFAKNVGVGGTWFITGNLI